MAGCSKITACGNVGIGIRPFSEAMTEAKDVQAAEAAEAAVVGVPWKKGMRR